MSWTFDNKKPIYLQIMEKIKLQIVSHTLEANQQLPTVRELASEAGVNPNTIQRALSDLEREGFVYSKRTTGRFVTEDKELIAQLCACCRQILLVRGLTRLFGWCWD